MMDGKTVRGVIEQNLAISKSQGVNATVFEEEMYVIELCAKADSCKGLSSTRIYTVSVSYGRSIWNPS